MKKFLLGVATLLSLSAVSVEAQSNYGGVMAGANFSTIEPEPTIDYKRKLGYHLGAFYHLGISEKIGFRPELLYSRKGYRVKSDDLNLTDTLGNTLSTNAVFEGRRSFSIIELPLLFTYTRSADHGFQIFAGPTIGLIFSSVSKTEITAENIEQRDKDSSMDGINTFQLGANLGVGYLLENGLGFQFRVDHGISKYFEEDRAESRNFNLMLGMSYRLGGE